MVANLLAAYADRIDRLPWMSATPKSEAPAMLHEFNVKLSYPKKRRDCGGLNGSLAHVLCLNGAFGVTSGDTLCMAPENRVLLC